jgi:hypothetical protein
MTSVPTAPRDQTSSNAGSVVVEVGVVFMKQPSSGWLPPSSGELASRATSSTVA